MLGRAFRLKEQWTTGCSSEVTTTLDLVASQTCWAFRRRAVAVTMRFLALSALIALALAASAANDDYVALKALYEATGGSAWK